MKELPAVDQARMKERLECMEKRELIRLVKELIGLNKDNRAYVEAKLCDPAERPGAIEHYRKIVKNEFFPSRGFGGLKLRTAKKAISDFKKATGDLNGTLDLMLYYVEQGTRFTNEYGDIDERFYTSMENTFQKVIDTLEKENDGELTDNFLPRLHDIVADADGTGWGYYDTLSDMLDDFLGMGEELE